MLDAGLWIAAQVRGDHWIGVGARLVGAALAATVVALAVWSNAAAPTPFYRPVFRFLSRTKRHRWTGPYAMLAALALLVVIGDLFAAALRATRPTSPPTRSRDAARAICLANTRA